jgi:hypothetical protein
MEHRERGRIIAKQCLINFKRLFTGYMSKDLTF